MPLGERAGNKESRYCGVETEFNDDVPQLLAYNISSGGFDFAVAPLMVRKGSQASFHELYSIVLDKDVLVSDYLDSFGNYQGSSGLGPGVPSPIPRPIVLLENPSGGAGQNVVDPIMQSRVPSAVLPVAGAL